MKAKRKPRSNRVASDDELERISLVRVDRFDWKTAALYIGEHLSDQGPNGYYKMKPEEWMEWAKDAIEKMRSNGPITGAPQGASELKAMLERAKADERATCIAILDAEASRQEKAWEEHLASGVGGPATSYHTIVRHCADMLRSNAPLSRERSESDSSG